MKSTKSFVFGVVLGLSFFMATSPRANPVSDDVFLEVYQNLMGPACEKKNQTEGTTLDCTKVDQTEFACWKDKLNLYYDSDTIQGFLEEIRQSNEKYSWYGEPYYNEFFSNFNWDTILAVTGDC